MKRIALIFILSVFLFNIAGYYFLFLFLDSENRIEMQSSLLNEALQTIHIPKSELKNIIVSEDGKEISYKEEMYDIQSVSDDGNFIVFKCLNDKKETSLFSQLDKNIKNNSDSPLKKSSDTKNPVKDLFLVEKNNFVSSSVHFEFPSAICHFTSYITLLLSPPPKAA